MPAPHDTHQHQYASSTADRLLTTVMVMLFAVAAAATFGIVLYSKFAPAIEHLIRVLNGTA